MLCNFEDLFTMFKWAQDDDIFMQPESSPVWSNIKEIYEYVEFDTAERMFKSNK